MGTFTSRRSARSSIAIPDGEIHVWRASLELEPDAISHLEKTLSEDERARAARFYRTRDREHFICARGILRDLLAKYIAVTPEAVEICYAAQGKPFVDKREAGAPISFNLSTRTALRCMQSRAVAKSALTLS